MVIFFSVITLALVHQSFQVAKLNSSLVRSNLFCCGFEIYCAKSNWDPKRRLSWIGYNIDTYTGLSFATDPELKSFALILMIFVLVWSFLPVFT